MCACVHARARYSFYSMDRGEGGRDGVEKGEEAGRREMNLTVLLIHI